MTAADANGLGDQTGQIRSLFARRQGCGVDSGGAGIAPMHLHTDEKAAGQLRPRCAGIEERWRGVRHPPLAQQGVRLQHCLHVVLPWRCMSACALYGKPPPPLCWGMGCAGGMHNTRAMMRVPPGGSRPPLASAGTGVAPPPALPVSTGRSAPASTGHSRLSEGQQGSNHCAFPSHTLACTAPCSQSSRRRSHGGSESRCRAAACSATQRHPQSISPSKSTHSMERCPGPRSKCKVCCAPSSRCCRLCLKSEALVAPSASRCSGAGRTLCAGLAGGGAQREEREGACRLYHPYSRHMHRARYPPTQLRRSHSRF